MEQKKIVLDTNTLISAFGWKGNPRKALEQVIKKRAVLFVSPQTFQEFCKVLEYPKFSFSEQRKNRLKSFLLAISTTTNPKIRLNIIRGDPEDNRILEAALEAKADYVITGDKHLLNLKEFKGIKIVKAKQFLGEPK